MLLDNGNPLVDEINRKFKQAEHSRELCRLADALVYGLNLADGSALVPFIAPGRATNNRDAVLEWLCQQLESPSLELSEACVQVLLPKLHRKIEDSLEAANDAYF